MIKKTKFKIEFLLPISIMLGILGWSFYSTGKIVYFFIMGRNFSSLLKTSGFIYEYVGFAIFIVLVRAILHGFYKRTLFKKRKKIIEKNGLTEDLLKKLKRTNIQFPIKGSGGVWGQTISLRSLTTYKNNYLFGTTDLIGTAKSGLNAKKIIDNNGKEYSLKRIKLKKLGYTTPEVANLEFEQVIPTGSSVDFATIKQEILNEIEKNGKSSAYYNLKDKIKNAKNMTVLDKILEKGEY